MERSGSKGLCSNNRIKEWEVEPRVGRMADGVANWMDRLRACGNGVVPQQAKLALEILIARLNQVLSSNQEIKDSKS